MKVMLDTNVLIFSIKMLEEFLITQSKTGC